MNNFNELNKEDLIPFSKIEKKTVEWLVNPYIPKNTFVLVEGEESSGKSTFVSHIVASLSASKEPLSGVFLDRSYISLYISTEEDSNAVLAPRFEAQGGNLEKIFMIKNPQEIFSDLKKLEKIVKKNKIDILVVDPLASITGNIDSNSERDVRQFLEPLIARLSDLNLTLIGIRHHGKSSKNARRKGLGSVAFSSLVRSIITLYEDDSNNNIKYLTHAKNNFGSKQKTRIFYIEKKGIITWGSEINITADNLALNDPNKTEPKILKKNKAEILLLEELKDNKQIPVNDLIKKAKKLGISKRTLENAKNDLGVKAIKKYTNWAWILPTKTIIN